LELTDIGMACVGAYYFTLTRKNNNSSKRFSLNNDFILFLKL